MNGHTCSSHGSLVGWLVVGSFMSWQHLRSYPNGYQLVYGAHSWRFYSAAPLGDLAARTMTVHTHGDYIAIGEQTTSTMT